MIVLAAVLLVGGLIGFTLVVLTLDKRITALEARTKEGE